MKREFMLGQKVYHKDIFDGQRPLQIMDIDRNANLFFLEGDYSEKNDALYQLCSWQSYEGLFKDNQIYTIQDLAEGRCLCFCTGQKDITKVVLLSTFPEDKWIVDNEHAANEFLSRKDETVFYRSSVNKTAWESKKVNDAPNLPIQHVEIFYKDLMQNKKEETQTFFVLKEKFARTRVADTVNMLFDTNVNWNDPAVGWFDSNSHCYDKMLKYNVEEWFEIAKNERTKHKYKEFEIEIEAGKIYHEDKDITDDFKDMLASFNKVYEFKNWVGRVSEIEFAFNTAAPSVFLSLDNLKAIEKERYGSLTPTRINKN